MTQPSANSEKAYAASGVDIDLGNRLKSGIQKRIQSATHKEVLSKIGGFGGLFDARFKGLQPLWVRGTLNEGFRCTYRANATLLWSTLPKRKLGEERLVPIVHGLWAVPKSAADTSQRDEAFVRTVTP